MLRGLEPMRGPDSYGFIVEAGWRGEPAETSEAIERIEDKFSLFHETKELGAEHAGFFHSGSDD
jgi:hypothetical protein